MCIQTQRQQQVKYITDEIYSDGGDCGVTLSMWMGDRHQRSLTLL